MVDTKVPLSSICHNYNLYITLRCKIVAGQSAHKLADALPADIRKSSHGQQSVAPLAALAPQLPAHRAGLSPTALTCTPKVRQKLLGLCLEQNIHWKKN